MTDSTPIMLGKVELRLRLVYQATSNSLASPDTPAATSASPAASASSAATRAFPAAPSDSFASVPASLAADSGGTGVPGWRLVDLLPEDIAEAPSGVGEDASANNKQACFVTAPITLSLNRDEAEGYYLNLTSPQPSLFALIRLPDVGAATAAQATSGVPEAEAITVSYSEAARWMDGGMVVIRTPVPEPMLAWIAEFAQYHFQAEGKKKRGKFRPSFLSRQQFGEVAKAEKQEASLAAVVGSPEIESPERRH